MGDAVSVQKGCGECLKWFSINQVCCVSSGFMSAVTQCGLSCGRTELNTPTLCTRLSWARLRAYWDPTPPPTASSQSLLPLLFPRLCMFTHKHTHTHTWTKVSNFRDLLLKFLFSNISCIVYGWLVIVLCRLSAHVVTLHPVFLVTV